jgi:hypothetical protein
VQSYFSAFVKVIFILSLGSLAKDFSSRTVVEEVFERKTDTGLDIGELEGLTVAPSHKYPFIACNDSNEPKIYVSLASFLYEANEWMSYGWIPLSQGCSVIDLDMRGPIYGYAISSNKEVIWGGNFIGQSAPFCLNSGNSFHSTLEGCSKGVNEDMTLELFSRLHVPSSRYGMAKPFIWRIKSSDKLLSH